MVCNVYTLEFPVPRPLHAGLSLLQLTIRLLPLRLQEVGDLTCDGFLKVLCLLRTVALHFTNIVPPNVPNYAGTNSTHISIVRTAVHVRANANGKVIGLILAHTDLGH